MESKIHDTIPDRSPMDGAEHLFQLVAGEPYGLSLDGTLAPDLPRRPIPLTELRRLLTRRTVSNATRDIVWRELVVRARAMGPTWLVGSVGVALPALRGIAGRITSGYLVGDPADIDNEVLATFIDGVRTIEVDSPNVLPRLCDAARRAGERARRLAESGVCRRLPVHVSVPPPHPWDHPDFVLFNAVAKGVVSGLDAELIGRTRLEHMTLAAAADELGLTPEAAKKRRQRAEPVLCAAVQAGEVEAGLSLMITSADTRRAGAQTSARSRSSSDTQSELHESKGGRGTTSGTARTSPTPAAEPFPAYTTAAAEERRPSWQGSASFPAGTAELAAGLCQDSRDGTYLPSRAAGLRQAATALASRLPRWCRRAGHILAVVAIVAVVVTAVATVVFAETGTRAGPPTSPDQLGRVFDNLRNWLIGLLATLATLMLTIGGLRYLVAGGDPGEVQKAKAALKAAALGYGLAVLAPLFVNVLKRVVGG